MNDLISIKHLRKEIETYLEKEKSGLDFQVYFGMVILYEQIDKILKEVNKE